MERSSHSSACFSATFLLLTFSDFFSVIDHLYSLFPYTQHLLSLLRTPQMCREMVILHFSKSPNHLNQLHPHVQRANERPKRDSILSPSQVLNILFFWVFVILCCTYACFPKFYPLSCVVITNFLYCNLIYAFLWIPVSKLIHEFLFSVIVRSETLYSLSLFCHSHCRMVHSYDQVVNIICNLM